MKTLLLILISLSILSCQSVSPPEPPTHKNSNLTHGNVQMHIATGVTTKAQILEVFGARDREDIPILDAHIYQNAFKKIGSAIFLREASQ